MTPKGESAQRHSTSRSKTQDQAFLIPFLGIIFLLPPAADIFQLDGRILGIPFTAFYLFTVWALLITGAAFLSVRLKQYHLKAPEGDQDPNQPD